jgi:hypothetical protein
MPVPCALPSPIVSAAKVSATAAQVRGLGFALVFRGSGRELRLDPVRGARGFAGATHGRPHTLAEGWSRPLIEKPHGSTLLDRGL